jgi:lysozyme family protein
MYEDFKKSLEFILKWEGGWSQNKNPQLSTMKGISQKTYDRYRYAKDLEQQSVRKIAQEELEDIYYNNLWVPSTCSNLPFPMCLVLLDSIVCDGFEIASILLKKSHWEINGAVDGAERYIDLRRIYYQELSEREYATFLTTRALNQRCLELQRVVIETK